MDGEEKEETPGKEGEAGTLATDTVDSDNEHKIKLDEESPEKSLKSDEGSPEEGAGLSASKTAEEGAGPNAGETAEEGAGPAEEGPISSRPQSSASSLRAKSSASGEIVFQAKKKKKRGGSPTPDDAYTVTFTVSIAMAIPTVEDEDQPDLKDLLRKKKRVFEAPRAQNYYHVEYYLMPGDDELMKTDIVSYGMAAKLYMERHDARVIKTWQDGELTWIAWAHSHSMTVTKDMLLKLYAHTLELRVWDTKDKCSTRARFDRPKAFRLPQPKPGESPEDVGGVKAMVQKQLGGHSLMQSPKAGTVRPLPQRCSFPRADTKKKAVSPGGSPRQQPSPGPSSAKGAKKLVAVPNKGAKGTNTRTFSRLGRLAGAERPVQSPGGKESKASKSSVASSDTRLATLAPPPPCSAAASSVKSAPPTPSPLPSRAHLRSGESEGSGVTSMVKDMVLPEDSATARRRQKKVEAAAAVAAENAKKFGVCVVPFRMALLFSGAESITGRLNQPVSGVEDLFITVSLDQPLMSEEQKRQLNPMIITVKSATDMPSCPMSYQELSSKCQPVYCKYQFFKQPMHITGAKDHQQNIYWDDKNVVLLGPQEASELREYLSGPAMELEVHDRDRRAEDVKLKASLFGDDLEDEKISNVGTVASRRTLHNPFSGRNKPWDPYGVCHVDLSELLLGQRFLELRVPLQCCPLPDVLGVDGAPGSRLMGVAGAVDGPVDRPLSAGSYMRAGSAVKIQVELAYPLVTPPSLAAKEDLDTTQQCPFGRILFILAYKNTAMLSRLQTLVMEINAIALELDDMPRHVIDAALSTYKLSIEQQVSGTLDIVTGFHVLDGEKHMFVLEGLRDRAVKRLWEELPRPEESDVRVLYNSDFSFSRRLYGPLDVDLCRVKLHEPLSLVVQQSLLYVRDMVPRPCFTALTRLEEMTRMHLMKDVVKNDIFPTADMVVSMSKEFGVPFTAQDFEELLPDWERSPVPTAAETAAIAQQTPVVMVETTRDWTPIDKFNNTFVEHLAQRKEKGSSHDFIGQNKDQIKHESDHNMLVREQTRVPMIQAPVVKGHNYSTQTLNSTELANQELRLLLKEQHPGTGFTRSQTFLHSGTVVPVDVPGLSRAEAQRSWELWRTPNGWTYPGKRTMIESNAHPMKPDPARITELEEKWRENILHVSELQPTLNRDRLPWNFRQYDMELYAKPPPAFQEEPLSIHLAGVKKQAEKVEAREREAEVWRSRLVVADTDQHFHRVLPGTEMTQAGFHSSNQLDRLTCLLKDAPHKLSLRQTHVRDIPPLAVVSNPKVDTLGRLQGLALTPAVAGEGQERVEGFKPGPFTLSSWSMADNHVPAHIYDHPTHAARHGKDFNLVHTERQKVWKRPIVPLRESERDNHLFEPRIGTFSFFPPAPALPAIDAATSTGDLAQTKSLPEREMVYV